MIGARPVSARQIEGGVTAPRGFRAAGVACGIKRRPAGSASAPLDFALVAADEPVSAAAVFTTNKAVAAPIVVSREHLATSGGRARVDCRQQRLRERVHRRGRACTSRATWPMRPPARSAARPSTS